MIVDATWITVLFLVSVAYYFILMGIMLYKNSTKQVLTSDYSPFFILVVPARNEELVIDKTIESMLQFNYENYIVMIMNDGSTDNTSAIARQFEGTGKIKVIDRGPDIAGKGKGAVLNHAYKIISEEIQKFETEGKPFISFPDNMQVQDVVICIVDADGQLEPDCLRIVSPYFEDTKVGAAQLPVRIWNSTDNWLTRMQDIEFVGFSLFVQSARDLLGSVGLGGNGQFIRLVTLRDLGDKPWTDCLTEDLDIGIRAIKKGWKLRFCPDTFVAQHGLRSLRALLKQRTRWVQGHYTCCGHIPTLWTTRKVKLSARIDSTIYLGFVTFILLVGLNILLSILSSLGYIILENKVFVFLDTLPYSWFWFPLLAFLPIFLLLATYYKYSRENTLPIIVFPFLVVLFTIYTYVYVPANLKALWNMAMSNEAWVKTSRSS